MCLQKKTELYLKYFIILNVTMFLYKYVFGWCIVEPLMNYKSFLINGWIISKQIITYTDYGLYIHNINYNTLLYRTLVTLKCSKT